eukprot:TRINITY_DN2868_c0_g1_i1.p1 TRINITY_DN2868_c0_g1~~TRINITY_DN2868_c0_g1_i1.p1  ORF type:complete len:907 (-),score=279.95 TRINITY_DN2868_c0_g1_i1:69-2789(-)
MPKVDYDFIVEYAKSDRSSCKTTKEKIGKGEMRIGQMVQAPNFDGKIPHWHFWKNFFAKGNKGLTQWEMLHGRENLRPDDQKKIQDLIEKHNGGTKRKADDAGDDEPASKKQKVETPEEKEKRENAALIWKFKDAFKDFKLKDLKEICSENGQSEKGGMDDVLNRIASGMLYGAPPHSCGEEGCEEGHIFWDASEAVYKCSGHTSGWTKCIYEATQDEIKIEDYVIPDWAREDSKFLEKWVFKQHKRPNEKRVIVRAAATEDMEGRAEEELKEAKKNRSFFKVGTKTEKPFDGFLIAFGGKLSQTAGKLQKIVEDLGGEYSAKVTIHVTHVISTEKQCAKLPKSAQDVKGKGKLDLAIKYDIPILSEDWIHETEERGEFLNQSDYLVGGSKTARAALKRDFTDPNEEEKDRKVKESAEKKVKLVMKGRCAVDPSCGQKVVDQYHVLDKGKTEIYNVVLNMTDIQKGSNGYYALQVLEHDDKKKEKFKLFRKWGRVGTTFGGQKIEDFDDEESAIALFEELYLDKTGNDWSDRDNFEKKAGKFFPIEIDYSGEKKDDAEPVVDRKSTLDTRVQSLIELIFDVKVIEESLKEMEIDLKKMPLGNLSKRHIQTGYEVLRKIDAALADDSLTEKKKEATLVSLTNQFYTLIPHDFGARDPTIINTREVLDTKMKLMEALIDIEIATKLMSTGTEGESPIDANYKKLKTDLKPVDKGDTEWNWIDKYLQNQKGYFKTATLCDVFKVDREGANDVFAEAAPLGNRQLLWHGSRVSNYVGILSQGLRIAPPEAPKSGYRFGKGIYFADLCEKSIGYCRGAGSDYILMMLVEVALGKQAELLKDQYMEKSLPGFDSTKAMGGIAPSETMTLPDGTIVPYGAPKNTGIKSSCTHNEYIVYTVPQACIRYLLKIKI